jgi:hypothetical protein
MKSHPTIPHAFVSRLWMGAAVVLACLGAAGDALAYKVERVCAMTEATNKKPAVNVCKTLLVQARPGAVKDEKKEAPPAQQPGAAVH